MIEGSKAQTTVKKEKKVKVLFGSNEGTIRVSGILVFYVFL